MTRAGHKRRGNVTYHLFEVKETQKLRAAGVPGWLRRKEGRREGKKEGRKKEREREKKKVTFVSNSNIWLYL